jgi:hypothetical protein
VRRVRVRTGSWAGSHGGDGTITFDVANEGREVGLFTFRPSPWFRCSDGSAYRYPDYVRGTRSDWIGRDGRFAIYDIEEDWLLFVSGSLSPTRASGSFRIVESHPDARGVCDTGTLSFTARWGLP